MLAFLVKIVSTVSMILEDCDHHTSHVCMYLPLYWNFTDPWLEAGMVKWLYCPSVYKFDYPRRPTLAC